MENLIECTSLAVGYPRNAVLTSISFHLPAGESLLIIGHNGAGKSTLLRTLGGLLAPLGGEGLVLGIRIGTLTPRSLLLRGGRFLGQGTRAFAEMNVRDSRKVLHRLYGFTSETYIDGPSASLRKQIGRLSIGQRRMEALQLLSAGEPRLIFLDEPLAGLDPGNEKRVLRWIAEWRARGTAFVIVEQRFRDLLVDLDRVLVLRSGTITFNGEAKRVRNPECLATVLL